MCLLLLLACGMVPLTIDSVEPDRAEPGQQVWVYGRGFSDEVRAEVGSEPLAEVRVVGTHALTGFVPALSEGGWDVVLTRGEEQAVLPAGLEVLEPVDPCAPGFAQNTTLSWAEAVVEVRRFYPDGSEESERWPLARVQHLELEQRPGCQALYLCAAGKERLLYDADPEGGLETRAAHLGHALGRRVRRVERR